jgi:alkylation response protein AidB-like acyl-CoA dehydrogenase
MIRRGATASARSAGWTRRGRIGHGAAAAVEALFAPAPAVAHHPAVRSAARLAREVLAPHAAAADDPSRGVDPAHLALLAEAGLYSVTVPVDEGGLGADAGVAAETVELIGGACGATWFVMTQHQIPEAAARGVLLPAYEATPGRAAARHRRDLAAATAQAGTAVAHLRRPGPPALRATPVGDAWRLSGVADWCTGWGLIDLVVLGATAPDDRVLLVLLRAREQPGLRAGPPRALSVMGGTHTVDLTVDDLVVTPDDVLTVVDGAAWRTADVVRNSNAKPAAFGLLRRILGTLAAVGEKRGQPEAVDAAVHLGDRGVGLRAEAYALLTEAAVTERVPERTALRAELAELTVRAAHALVAARSGSALLADSPEQRWVREAGFHLVQAQTAQVRAAQVAALTR